MIRNRATVVAAATTAAAAAAHDLDDPVLLWRADETGVSVSLSRNHDNCGQMTARESGR